MDPFGLLAFQAPLSMGFFRQEYWSGLPFSSFGGNLPDPGIEPESPVSSAMQADSLSIEPAIGERWGILGAH